MEKFFTEDYDQVLEKEISHFTSYPQMLPFIGAKWKESSEKTLLLGESHFLPDWCKEIKSDKWYTGHGSLLSESERKNISTRHIVNNMYNKTEGQKTHSFFLNLAKELTTHVSYEARCPFISAGFYNYFQRPAPYGASLKTDKEDREQAYAVLQKLIRITEPRKVIFASKKAWLSFAGNRNADKDNPVFNGIYFGYTTHPSSIWWNRVSKSLGNKTGKQKFIDLLKQ